MKTLKLNHRLAKAIASNGKTSTWRLFDEKNIAVNDVVLAIDKLKPKDRSTWQVFGKLTINKIVEKRLRDVSESDYDDYDRYYSLEQMLGVFRGYYRGKTVSPDTPVKILYFSYEPYKQAKVDTNLVEQQIETGVKKSTKKVKLYSDGGSRGNPGPSASGYVLLSDKDELIEQKGVYLGVTTNNVAEYQALKLGLEAALAAGVHRVSSYMDSMLVVNQMKGIFKVKNRDLWPIHDSIKQLLPRFDEVSFTHVPRELNKLADKQVNLAMDNHLAEVTTDVNADPKVL